MELGRKEAHWSWERLSPRLYHVLRLGLAGLFVLAGALKLADPRAFAQAVSQYGLVPDGLVPLVALGLPVAEVAAGLGLLFDARGSLGAILVMLLAFTGVLGYAILFDLDIDCGCFTTLEILARESVRTAFARDLVLLGAVVFLLWHRRIRRKKFPTLEK